MNPLLPPSLPRASRRGPTWVKCLTGSLLAVTVLPGCVAPRASETQARDRVDRLGRMLAPGSPRPAPSPLGAESTLGDYTRLAVLNHPAVFAAYLDWKASVTSISAARSLPDPQFVFEADFTRTLLQFMPGLMFDVMSSAKRQSMAEEAAASGEVAYRAYVAQLVTVASGVRKPWVDIAYLEQTLQLRRASLALLGQVSDLALAGYETGSGMGSLQEPVRAADEVARARSEIDGLQARLAAAHAALKSALGLLPSDPDPVWPHPGLSSTRLPSDDELWARIRISNPELAQMRAMVDMAVASVEVSRRQGTPNLSIGAMEDLKSSPLLTRPLASVTLPIWRSKIADSVAASQARRDAASARLDAARLDLAAELARLLALIREADRTLSYIDHEAIPSTERTLATAQAGYQATGANAGMIPQARLRAVSLSLERTDALRDRESAVTDLFLMSADALPADTPLLAEAHRPTS